MVHSGDPGLLQAVDTSQASASAHSALSHAFKRLLQEHPAGFALVKRLGMRSDQQTRGLDSTSVDRSSPEFREMAELYAALREIVLTQAQPMDDAAGASDLADAMATLDAINPGSPEWGPGFLQVSELVEAQIGASP